MMTASPHWHIVHRPLDYQEGQEYLLMSPAYRDVFAAAEALVRYVLAAPESAFLVSLYWEPATENCRNPGEDWAEEV
jgi:hypothetical protein